MATAESKLRIVIQKLIQRYGGRLWRNNTGIAVFGKRRVRYGLGVGSPDLVGILPMKITQEDVGKTYGLFVGIEVKTPNARVAKAQKEWIKGIERLGGIAGIAYHEDDVEHLIAELDGGEDG